MKVEFVTALDLRYLGRGTWLVRAPFRCRVDGVPVIVPKGYETDLDSIPRWPVIYWLAKNRAVWSSLLHDYLYSSRYGWWRSDRVMYAAMKAERVRRIFRVLIYLGLCLGGWYGYYVKPCCRRLWRKWIG